MDKQAILGFLQGSYPPELIQFAVNYANPTYKERIAIDLCGIKNMTQAMAAEQAELSGMLPSCSEDSMQRYFSSAMRKLDTSWSSQRWMNKLTS